MDSRAVSPVVGKLFEVGLVTLYVTLLATTLYGGVVPDYRADAAAEVGERTLASAVQRVEAAVPPAAESVDVRHRVPLPSTIADEAYAIRTDGETLVLDHPLDDVGGRARVALPPTVARLTGTWHSGANAVVAVEDRPAGLVVRLTEGSP